MNEHSRIALASWLAEAAETVRGLEAQALTALSGEEGQAGYERVMREKAFFLAGLAEEGQTVAAGFDTVMERLERFSRSASSALSVGSVFFMSALLYPEDHKPGQKNDLESLVKEIEKTVR